SCANLGIDTLRHTSASIATWSRILSAPYPQPARENRLPAKPRRNLPLKRVRHSSDCLAEVLTKSHVGSDADERTGSNFAASGTSAGARGRIAKFRAWEIPARRNRIARNRRRRLFGTAREKMALRPASSLRQTVRFLLWQNLPAPIGQVCAR